MGLKSAQRKKRLNRVLCDGDWRRDGSMAYGIARRSRRSVLRFISQPSAARRSRHVKVGVRIHTAPQLVVRYGKFLPTSAIQTQVR
jgi:hypothetical protein